MNVRVVRTSLRQSFGPFESQRGSNDRTRTSNSRRPNVSNDPERLNGHRSDRRRGCRSPTSSPSSSRASSTRSCARSSKIARPQALFVDRPRRVVRLVLFLVTAAALAFPALSLAGYRTLFGGNPEALMRWLLDAGLRIAIIAVAAYFVIRIGSAAARRFEREMSRGTGLDVIERTKRAQTLGTPVAEGAVGRSSSASPD